MLLTNDWLADNHVDAFAFFLLEQSRLMAEKFHPYLYISPLYRVSINNILILFFTLVFPYRTKLLQVYKSYSMDYQIFINHINPVSIQESKLIVLPIIHEKHWVLLVGKLKEKVWKMYDSLPNPEHKNICHTVVSSNSYFKLYPDYYVYIHNINFYNVLFVQIKYLHEDTTGCFSSDITKWNVQAVRGIPTQSNNYDCGIFVCKYMEKAVRRKKPDWNALKDWQKHMPKFRAEFAFFLFLQTKK
ncbi:hypothetical protein KFK09_014246 [Dendrobium nobile]|uniref:Ubiquitin-like protease family profile domain-containing protein n=1 Tax=Dendrobium nobile TaxID=94219 RepID=A0A8T3BC15_DENNO|nr:hypothetical protein KFK09_014246 [Dendrobium nobile]